MKGTLKGNFERYRGDNLPHTDGGAGRHHPLSVMGWTAGKFPAAGASADQAARLVVLAAACEALTALVVTALKLASTMSAACLAALCTLS